MDVLRSQRGSHRDASPDRAKICRLKQRVKPARKVQVVYYLSRNGLLEHPHFMELTLLPNQPLRLKDVLDRLMALRGSGMPLQYSWSSKRSYKSGYVWYDLAVKDIIHPAEGGEYVLKGSELVEGCSERFQQLNVRNKQAIQGNYNYDYSSKRKSEEYEEEYEEEQEKTSNTSSTTTPHSRCSRGVSTEEVGDDQEEREGQNNENKNATTTKPTLAEKLNQRMNGNQAVTSAAAAAPSRYSVLLQLIACGSNSGSAELKGKQEGRVSNVGSKQRESVEMVVSENPRLLGNLVPEEKEYFSGSLVDSLKAHQGEPVLKKSNSYNEERRSRLGIEEKGGVKEKCIPLRK
ncbi:hypothetical protein RJT34_03276 [Clitoria ternatea]|uniref:SOSEKI DIX-like domain-containing protein n=1 Tax=Clitoria ternatea TaxID=43366 RepID=A0AAN9Q4X6_CLITE